MNKFDRYYMGNRDKCEKCGEKEAVYDYNGYLVFCTACERAAAKEQDARDYKMMMNALDGGTDSIDWADLDTEAKEK